MYKSSSRGNKVQLVSYFEPVDSVGAGELMVGGRPRRRTRLIYAVRYVKRGLANTDVGYMILKKIGPVVGF